MNSTIIGVAGGTGSGKSTFTQKIQQELGDKVAFIYHDNYYKARDELTFEERQMINYDHPDALDTDLLLRHIQELKQGKAIESPVYNYSLHNRDQRVIKVKPCSVIIVEGILIFQDQRLRDLFDIKIYVETDSDERILRRIVRDVRERGRDLQDIVSQYLTTVKPMHSLYVEPTKAFADIVINGGMNEVAYDIVTTKIRKLLQ